MARPLRSMLFTPGNRPRMVGKVATFGADAVILDLEDAVPNAEKVATRAVVREALPRLQPGPLRYVRVNAVETGRGVLNARALAEAGSRVRRLAFGAGDFCRDVGTRFSGRLWETDGLEL